MALPGNWTGCLAAGACRQVQVNIDVNGALSHRQWQTQRPFQAASLHPNRANSLTVFPACCQCQCLRARGPHRRPELGAAGRHLWGLVRCQCFNSDTGLISAILPVIVLWCHDRPGSLGPAFLVEAIPTCSWLGAASMWPSSDTLRLWPSEPDCDLPANHVSVSQMVWPGIPSISPEDGSLIPDPRWARSLLDL